MTGTALRTRILCVLAASAAACAPNKEGAPPQPAAPAPATVTATATATAEPSPPTPAPVAEVVPPAPGPTEVLTSGPTPPPPPPGVCNKPEKRCFAPRTNTSGGMVQVDLSKEPFDTNGCLPQARVGGSCAGYRATSAPAFRGGKCCYDGCASQPAPCGRPLFTLAGPRLAGLSRVAREGAATWSS